MNILGEEKKWNHMKSLVKTREGGTSLVVQQLRLHAPNSGGPGLIPGQGTRSLMPQLRACMPQDPACCN